MQGNHLGKMNLTNICKEMWRGVTAKVNRATVFMDDISAECLHWNGGAQMFFEAGAVNVKQFSSFENCKPEQRKAVFIIGTLLIGTTEQILKDIVSSSQLQYIIVISTISPALHTFMRYGNIEGEQRGIHYIEDKLLQWMGNMNYTAEVTYCPLVVAPITKHLFVLPSHSTFFPLLPTDLQIVQPESMDRKPGAGLDIHGLPRALQIKIKTLASGLHSSLDQLQLSEDVYALGATSQLLATELAQLPWAKTRRKGASARCSLLLIDRSLDVAEPLTNTKHTMLDRILAQLPRLPGHHNDVCVNMATVCSVNSNDDNQLVVPGCLAHPMDSVASSLFHTMATSKYKESLLEVHRQLVDAASRDALPIQLTGRPGRVTKQQINTHVELFRDKLSSVRKHCGLLQLSRAAAESEDPCDGLVALEKALVQALAEEDGPSPLAVLTEGVMREMEKPQEEKEFSIEDVFVLLLSVYSLTDNPNLVGSGQEESTLRSYLVKVIMDDGLNRLPDFLKQLVGEDEQLEERQVQLVVHDTFDKLKSLSDARTGMKQNSRLYSGDSVLSPGTRHSLLHNIATALFDPNKPELPDIECKSSGFTDKLKKGFGLFMSVSKPRPTDHPTVIVFVVGGVTSSEAKKITETATNIQVLVGGCSLLKPADLLHRMLVQDNLHPK